MNNPEQLTVGTFNIRGWSQEKHEQQPHNAWEHRAPLTLATIDSLHADCLGFQEFDEQNSTFYKKELEARGMHLLLGEPIENGRYNPIAYRSDKLKKVTTGNVTLNEKGQWGAEEKRAATYAILEETTGERKGQQTVFVNLHLDHKSEIARIEGTQKLISELRQYDGLPIIIVGDFNSSYYTPHEKTTSTSIPHELLLDAGFKDAFIESKPEQVQNPPTTFHDFEGQKYEADQYGSWHMDSVLYRDAHATSYKIHTDDEAEQIGNFASDHYPVVVTVNIPHQASRPIQAPEYPQQEVATS